MTLLIILFGILITLAGLVLIIKPDVIIGLLDQHRKNGWLHRAAIIVRILLAMLLIPLAGLSRYPMVIEILGWLSLIAAILLITMGRHNFKRLMTWVVSIAKPYGRIGGLLSAAFGVFLIHAFV